MPKAKRTKLIQTKAGSPYARCPRLPSFALVSVRVNDRQDFYDDNNAPIQHAEWQQGVARLKAACIHMRTNLDLTVTVNHEGSSPLPSAPIRLRLKLSIGGVETIIQTGPQAVAAVGDTLDFIIDTGVVVSRSIDETNVRLNDFALVPSDGSTAAIASRLVALKIYTVFGDALDDNVRDSTLVDPGVIAGADQVVRLKPFFSLAHVKQACEWAAGSFRLGTGNDNEEIVRKTILSIPQITYGEGARYYEINDGWNVWDNPRKRTGDCSQQASFFADVLGVLGVRAHDFELKCEHTHTNGKLYRRYFGEPDPDNWPTHGVVLVRYAGDQYRCYDTTFHNPRAITTLDEALQVDPAARFITPGWELWYLINTPNDIRSTSATLEAALTHAFDETAWRTDMNAKAALRFPAAEVQVDPGP